MAVTKAELLKENARLRTENAALKRAAKKHSAELRRTNRALTEAERQATDAVEQQTATSEILRVISSSPTDVEPVFETIVQSAARLCNGRFTAVYQFDGELVHFGAAHGLDPEGFERLRRNFPRRPDNHSLVTVAIRDGRVAHVVDFEAEPDAPPVSRAFADSVGARSQVVVPLLRDRHSVGAIAVLRVERDCSLSTSSPFFRPLPTRPSSRSRT